MLVTDEIRVRIHEDPAHDAWSGYGYAYTMEGVRYWTPVCPTVRELMYK